MVSDFKEVTMEAQYLAWHSSSTLAGTPSPWGKSQPLFRAQISLRALRFGQSKG